jgi:hypothetical protein
LVLIIMCGAFRSSPLRRSGAWICGVETGYRDVDVGESACPMARDHVNDLYVHCYGNIVDLFMYCPNVRTKYGT